MARRTIASQPVRIINLNYSDISLIKEWVSVFSSVEKLRDSIIEK